MDNFEHLTSDAFAMSLQLDVLFEQAQHLRSRRPTDPFNIEEYRPGQLLKVIYWRGLSTCNYEAVMGPDGKMRPSIYSITIHIDPVDSQRPLCVSHYPELNAEDAFKVGNYIQGSCLSIENLLTRAIVVRAECMLNEIRRDIIPLCPGPITLGEVPLSLCIPILWPCLPHEYLHLRVDSTQGLIRASFPASDQQKCTPLLKDLEVAFNRPTARRVTLDRSSSIECRAGNRGMRNLAADDKRWQVRLGEIFSHLRCLLGQWRIKWSSRGRIVKDCLPISIPMQKVGRYPPRHAGYLQVLERVKQEHSLLSYIKLFPNDEYYLLCEVSPTVEGVLSVLYRYFLLKCTPLPTTVTDLRVAPEGRSLLHVSDDVVPDKDSQMVGVALQISHFFPLVGDSTEVLAGKLPSFSSLQFENKVSCIILSVSLLLDVINILLLISVINFQYSHRYANCDYLIYNELPKPGKESVTIDLGIAPLMINSRSTALLVGQCGQSSTSLNVHHLATSGRCTTIVNSD